MRLLSSVVMNEEFDKVCQKAVLDVKYCDYQRKMMKGGRERAKRILSKYSLWYKVSLFFSSEASGWNSETGNFSKINNRKILYNVARLHLRNN